MYSGHKLIPTVSDHVSRHLSLSMCLFSVVNQMGRMWPGAEETFLVLCPGG